MGFGVAQGFASPAPVDNETLTVHTGGGAGLALDGEAISVLLGGGSGTSLDSDESLTVAIA